MISISIRNYSSSTWRRVQSKEMGMSDRQSNFIFSLPLILHFQYITSEELLYVKARYYNRNIIVKSITRLEKERLHIVHKSLMNRDKSINAIPNLIFNNFTDFLTLHKMIPLLKKMQCISPSKIAKL